MKTDWHVIRVKKSTYAAVDSLRENCSKCGKRESMEQIIKILLRNVNIKPDVKT